MRENFTILKQLAALERPTFPVNRLPFRFPGPCLAAILDFLQQFEELGILLSKIGTWC